MDSSISNTQPMPDVQNYADTRNLAINRVGIKRIKSPATVQDKSVPQQTVAEFDMSVFLPQDRKGTHMSRFAQLLNEFRNNAYSVANLAQMHNTMLDKLESQAGTLRLEFPYFIEKFAPVTGLAGVMDYDMALQADTVSGGETQISVQISAPVTTLCPCSKEISRYGAHSQRSRITIVVQPSNPTNFYWEDIITSAEQQASAQLYSQLKRADEKFVTEQAYDNPRFVEDLIREVAATLNENRDVARYSLEVENFESIHNHSAWARISQD